MSRILQLLRVILRHPELALYIRHVKILSSPSRPYKVAWQSPAHAMDWTKERGAKEYTDVIKQSRAIVARAKFPDSGKWNRALQDCDPYALVAILLSQCHNLRSLQLDYSFVWKSGFPGLMLRHALFSAPEGVLSTFNRLTTVDYGSNVRQSELLEEIEDFDSAPGYPACDPDQFMAWFYLPSIRSLAIWLRNANDVISNKGQQSNLNQLHTLLLPRTTIDEEEVPLLLSQTTSLKTLHLGMAYRWREQCALENGTCILQGLNSVTSVEKLSLALEYYPFTEGYYYFDSRKDHTLRKPFYGFLKQFPKLSSVEVPITLLLGLNAEATTKEVSKLLPSTLQELCLHWDCSELGSNPWWSQNQLFCIVQHLLGNVKSHTPHLKRITVRIMNNKNPNSYLEERGEVQAMCGWTGIDMEVVFDELSPGLWT